MQIITICFSDIKLSRHVSCESCGSFANGGYDAINKQVGWFHIYLHNELCNTELSLLDGCSNLLAVKRWLSFELDN